jgi:hypothetical protein
MAFYLYAQFGATNGTTTTDHGATATGFHAH